MLNPILVYLLVILLIARPYRVFNRRTLSIQESIHVEFVEKKSDTKHISIENDIAEMMT